MVEWVINLVLFCILSYCTVTVFVRTLKEMVETPRNDLTSAVFFLVMTFPIETGSLHI